MRKIIDHNGRLFGFISIVDVLVIALVALLALSLNTKKNNVPTGEAIETTAITFQITAVSLPKYIADSIEVGDVIYDDDKFSGGAIGTITEIAILPPSVIASFPDGTLALVEKEDYYDVVMTIEGTGTTTNGYYRINGVYEIGRNASRNFYSKYAQFKAEITDIL